MLWSRTALSTGHTPATVVAWDESLSDCSDNYAGEGKQNGQLSALLVRDITKHHGTKGARNKRYGKRRPGAKGIPTEEIYVNLGREIPEYREFVPASRVTGFVI